MKSIVLSLTLWTAGALAVASLAGCDTGAEAAIPDMSTAALEIAIESSHGQVSPNVTPVTPDEKVPRAQCTECKGTGYVVQVDGNRSECGNCYKSAATRAACTCGDNCTCDNCPSDCLGELITLADHRPINTPDLQLAANRRSTSDGSETCGPNGCSSSGGDCETSGGSCDSSASHGSHSSGAGFFERGPARRWGKRILGAPFRLFRACRRGGC